MRKNCSSDREKLLKFEAEGREFSKFLRSLEQSMKTVKSEQFLVTECFFNLFLKVSQISKNRTIIIQIGKNYVLGFTKLQEKLENTFKIKQIGR